MTICRSCGTENPPGARFCLGCGEPLAPTCTSCGAELAPGARFCPSCGAPVQSVPGAPLRGGEERRVVTILFVDLVGFTERSDAADPEDVRRTLVPFHSRVTRDLERFGGTLDKFIGDAVMGVFGAPVAHEDDPERAVRAGLQILHTIEDLRRDDPRIAVRVAVNTGEAVVSFGEGPQPGEAVAGDVVNTASRMQSLAPRDSVVIGETTLRVVRRVFETEPLAPVRVKGKAEPLAAWRVVGERQDAAADVAPTVFVGRGLELEQLDAMFDRAVRGSGVQLVTLIGEPGLGKTRVIGEFRRRVSERAAWVAGRFVPYGETSTFAPIADTVRAIAGMGREGGEAAEAALEGLVARIEPDPGEREWLRSRLGPVLGVSTEVPGQVVPAPEIAQAWSRVIGAEAERRPLVVELEDLHWAEPAALELIQLVADRLEGLPVLVLCSARPELLERERWAGGRRNSMTLGLSPLTGDETDALLTDLLAQLPIAAPQRASLRERAGGNPLYALEFARMLGERATQPEGSEQDVPDSVQAVVAARLDAIPGDLRGLVQDASVLGMRFWPSALAATGRYEDEEARRGVDELVRRGLVERGRATSFEGEPEFGFTHALIREVAYGRLTRVERARRHCAAGAWIERVSGDRANERAEMLARHFASATELAEAAGERDFAAETCGPALRWLMASGSRASSLDPDGAFASFDRAARLAPAESRERADALSASAQSGRRSGRLESGEVLGRYEEALAISRALGDRVEIGAALTRVGSQSGAMGDSARSRELLAEAVDVLRDPPAGRDLARAYAYRAEEEMFAGRVESSMELAGRALDLLGDGSDELVVMCLHIRGDARCSLGDLRGLDNLREALRLAEAARNATDTVTSRNYLAEWLWAVEGPAAGLPHHEAALELAERRGIMSQGLYTKGGSIGLLFDLGDWDRAMRLCDELLGLAPERLDITVHALTRVHRSRIATLRGDREEADDPEELLARARPVEEMQALAPALVAAAEMALVDGDRSAAAGYVKEFAEATHGVAALYRESQLAAVARVCAKVDELALLRRLVEESQGLIRRDELNLLSARGILAEAEGDGPSAAMLYAEVAEDWAAFGNPLEEAEARLGLSRVTDERGAVERNRRRAGELLVRLRVPAGGGDETRPTAP
jgi:class 3 adenylate cyclase/tetratricopeptide (TPR) repeat protein